jgi:hypothetical protein
VVFIQRIRILEYSLENYKGEDADLIVFGSFVFVVAESHTKASSMAEMVLAYAEVYSDKLQSVSDSSLRLCNMEAEKWRQRGDLHGP